MHFYTAKACLALNLLFALSRMIFMQVVQSFFRRNH